MRDGALGAFLKAGPRGCTPQTMMLAGGFRCKLTNSEANEWHEYIHSRPEYSEWYRATEMLNCPAARMTDSECESLIQRRFALEQLLFTIGYEWYAGIVSRDTAEKPME